MGFNRNFYIKRSEIRWEDQIVCDVRGLTPNDIAKAVSENAADMEALVMMFEKDKIAAGFTGESEEINAFIQENTQTLFAKLLTTVPVLVAKLIAMACDAPTEWESISKLVVPLQFDIAREIMVLTFVDGEGFKKFLGNAMALADIAGQRQSPKVIEQETMPALTDG